MNEIGKAIIITKNEYKLLEDKAKLVVKQRYNTKSLNMRLRFPYYIPEESDVENHRELPISEILPYYTYLMTMDDNGNYIVEPDDETLNKTREYMRRVYEERIIIVENAIAEQELIDNILGKNPPNNKQ